MHERPVLYSFRRCPYAIRARLALSVSEIDCDLHEVSLRDKPAELLRLSPKGTVPVLVTEAGQVIDESLDIMLWALRRHDPEGWLQPPQQDLAAMLALIARFDGDFKHHLDRYKYPWRWPDIVAHQHRDAAAAQLIALDEMLASQAWLFGDRPSLADMAIVAFVRQYARTDQEWFDAQPWPHVHRWLHACLASPRFEAVMQKPVSVG